MFARIEVALRPEFPDFPADQLMKRLEHLQPALRAKIRWARLLDVHWLDLPPSREEIIGSATEIFWDRVTEWLFTGNLIPSAAGKSGGIQDLMEAAPQRPGKFWAIERRFRPGVADAVGRSVLEAFESHLGRPVSKDGIACSGGLLLLEGTALREEDLAFVAREVFTHSQIQTWTILNEADLKKNDRFHPERVKRDFPRPWSRALPSENASFALIPGGEKEWEAQIASRWETLGASKRKVLVDYFGDATVRAQRAELGIQDPREVEIALLDRVWQGTLKDRIFDRPLHYSESSETGVGLESAPGFEIPREIPSLRQGVLAPLREAFPRSWMVSTALSSSTLVSWDEELLLGLSLVGTGGLFNDAASAVGTCLRESQGALLGLGTGGRAAFHSQVVACPPPGSTASMPTPFLSHRLLEGISRGTAAALGASGVPRINGAYTFDESFRGAPMVSFLAGGWIPGRRGETRTESVHPEVGDSLWLLGEPTGKSCRPRTSENFTSWEHYLDSERFELEDSLAQRRLQDFLLAARDAGVLRGIRAVGERGLAWEAWSLSRACGGVTLDASRIPQRAVRLPVSEILLSDSPGRFVVAVQEASGEEFEKLLELHLVAGARIGSFTDRDALDVVDEQGARIIHLQSRLFQHAFPADALPARWSGGEALRSIDGSLSLGDSGPKALLGLLARPAVCSKESLLQGGELEVQGKSVVKPFHSAQTGTLQEWSGPNDCGAVLPNVASNVAVVVGTGVQTRFHRYDPYLQGMASVDEAMRNSLSVGIEYGRPESFIGLLSFLGIAGAESSPERVGSCVRAAFGVRKAALELSLPLLVSQETATPSVSVPFSPAGSSGMANPSAGTLVAITAVGRSAEARSMHLADFKFAGDFIYLLGPGKFALGGSEVAALAGGLCPGPAHLPVPDWEVARRVYTWLGRSQGTEQGRLRSLHDVSEGGLLVSVSEGLLARGLGAQLQIPESRHPWEFAFGEGFHTFVASCAELDAGALEAEWLGLGVPFLRLGRVTSSPRLEVRQPGASGFQLETELLRAAWSREEKWS